jgi:hypothetical protein
MAQFVLEYLQVVVLADEGATLMKKLLLVVLSGCLLTVLVVVPARATIINFESRPVGPSLFADLVGSPQTFTIGGVTFTGGGILTATANLPADETNVYGTASFAPGPTLNPLTVTFPADINNFFLDVFNGQTSNQNYTVADNLGNSATFNLVPNLTSGQTTVGFPAAGNIITITSLGGTTAPWDFFIDNIHYNEPLPTIPEPSSILLLGLGLLGLIGAKRRARK